MRLTRLTAIAAGCLIFATAGCASGGGAEGSTGRVDPESLVAQFDAPDSNLHLKPGTAKLLEVHNDVAFVTAESDSAEDPNLDLCLLPFSNSGTDLGGVCTDKSPAILIIRGTAYAYGEKPSAEFGDNWEEESPDFWIGEPTERLAEPEPSSSLSD